LEPDAATPATRRTRDSASHDGQHPAGSTVIDLRGVAKHYDAAAGPVPVLVGVDLAIVRGEAVALKGVSGSGKSTLLHILGAIERPDGGTVTVCGQDLAGMDARARTSFRARQIGFVFQFFNLIPTLTARENVIASLEPLGGTRASRDEMAAGALRSVGLGDHLDKYPAQLSGGEQQRVAIARAVAKRPAVLLADEPTGALDETTARQVLELLDAVRREHGCAVVIATHDPAVAAHVDRVVRLERGRLVGELP
jgi:putative ABC transport system ATP-binding protein